jgi:hypothetical protein
MNTNTALVPGSLAAIAKTNNVSLAETFLSAEAIIIVDVSGSMSDHDARGGKSRYEVALDELARLQAQLPGRLAVIEFSSTVRFVPSGAPSFQGGGTQLAEALRFTKVADVPGAMRFFVISDGEPGDPDEALKIARSYQNKIDTIFVGPEEDWAGGRDFLQRLAQASGGQAVTCDRLKELAPTIERLLLTA